MKKNIFKKMFCKMYIVSSYSYVSFIFMVYFYILFVKIYIWWIGSVIVDM